MPSTKQGPWKSPRRHVIDGVTYLNTPAVAEALGLTPRTVSRRQAAACWPTADGLLPSIPAPLANGRGASSEVAFPESVVMQLPEAKRTGPDDPYEVEGVLRIRREAAAKLLGVCWHTVRNYDHDGLLTGRRTVNPVTKKAEWSYALADVQEFAAGRSSPSPDTLTRNGREYLREDLACVRLSRTAQNLRKWALDRCPHLAALLGRIQERGHLWYDVGQLEQLRGILEAHRSGRYLIGDTLYLPPVAFPSHTGCNVHRATLRELAEAGVIRSAEVGGRIGGQGVGAVYSPDDVLEYFKQPFRWFPAAFQDEHGRQGYTLAGGAKKFRFTLSFLKKQAAASPYHPAGRLPTFRPKRSPSPRLRKGLPRCVWKDDLEVLRQGIKDALTAGRLGSDWASAAELAKERGIKGLTGKIGSILRLLREAGRISATWAWRLVKITKGERKGQRTRRRIWFYLREEISPAVRMMRSHRTSSPSMPAPAAESRTGRNGQLQSAREPLASDLYLEALHKIAAVNREGYERIHAQLDRILDKLGQAPPEPSAPAVVGDIFTKLRRAINEHGIEAKAEVIIKEAGVRGKDGRKALRELEAIGEYRFARSKPRRYR